MNRDRGDAQQQGMGCRMMVSGAIRGRDEVPGGWMRGSGMRGRGGWSWRIVTMGTGIGGGGIGGGERGGV